MKLRHIVPLAMGLLCTPLTFAANWQLVWQDEFNGSIGPDWVFETGAGGWGNNEMEYYRRENATVENGALVITAKREEFGGAHYTSTRMTTQGRKTFKYGRIEARMKLPGKLGIWPAFWALGANIGSVGWPASGEIDIMEQINTGSEIYGTPHWQGTNGGHAEYSGHTTTSIQDYHVYAIEWDANFLRWFVDGQQYHAMEITNSVGGTDEFHRDFYLLLNMAVGGNWPGFNVDNGALPTRMYVDYVRVYKDGGTGGGGGGGATGQGFVGAQSQRCIDAPNGNNGTKILLWDCTGSANQQWSLQADGTLRAHGKCLDALGHGTTPGSPVGVWDCGSGGNQKWRVNGDGSIVGVESNLCLDVSGGATANNSPVALWTCNGGANQKWARR